MPVTSHGFLGFSQTFKALEGDIFSILEGNTMPVDISKCIMEELREAESSCAI